MKIARLILLFALISIVVLILAQKKLPEQSREVFLKETYILENGRLTITENSKIIWQSPADWQIDSFVLADSNNDGVVDINLSLWKAGNFGPSKPFWVKENDMAVKNHFFVLNLIGGKVKTIWGSSNLASPNCEFKIADIDGDGKNELITVEGDYSRKPKCEGKYVAVWQWNGWGFSNEWRSEKGNFPIFRRPIKNPAFGGIFDWAAPRPENCFRSINLCGFSHCPAKAGQDIEIPKKKFVQTFPEKEQTYTYSNVPSQQVK